MARLMLVSSVLERLLRPGVVAARLRWFKVLILMCCSAGFLTLSRRKRWDYGAGDLTASFGEDITGGRLGLGGDTPRETGSLILASASHDRTG